MREGKAGVGGAESWQGATLLWMEETRGSSDGGQSHPHYLFKHFPNRFDE